jgi:hypothetical protein
MFSYLATPKPNLGQYGVARNFAKLLKKKMTVFLTVFLAATAENRRGYWLVKPFNNIARYCERMLSSRLTENPSFSNATSPR